MSATYDLFTRWKAAKGLTSDNAGAVALGINRATVSLWKGGQNAEVDLIETMATDLGEDPLALVALVMKERTQGEAKKTWARLARRLGTAAALALCAVAVPVMTDASKAYASGLSASASYGSIQICLGEASGPGRPYWPPGTNEVDETCSSTHELRRPQDSLSAERPRLSLNMAPRAANACKSSGATHGCRQTARLPMPRAPRSLIDAGDILASRSTTLALNRVPHPRLQLSR